MEDIIWEDPPVRTRGDARVWVNRLQPLTEYPGKWANFGIVAQSTPSRLRKGALRLPETDTQGHELRGYFEFESRTRNAQGEQAPKGKMFLYARYLDEERASE